ncbi:MAG: hypothetical protein ACYDHD_04645 [Vulcanimicrobiaceae bacterium]
MSTNLIETVEKMNAQGLEALKAAQQQNLEAFTSLLDISEKLAQGKVEVPSLDGVPTPSQVVEMTFDAAGKFLELRKSYALQIAELMVATQKQAVEAAKHATKRATEFSK